MRIVGLITLLVVFIQFLGICQNNTLLDCEKDSIDGKPIYEIVEESPTYKNGINEFYKTLKRNIKYPKIENGVFPSSRIYICFVIDRKGKIRNLSFQPSTLEIDKAFIKKIDKWKAGKQNGKKVNVRITIPIRIRWG